MEKYTTRYSLNASLVMIAEWTHAQGLWEKLGAGVHIHQKTIVHSPQDKLKDLLIHIWAGGERLSDVNKRVRTDAALQRLFGRKACAEQSTISETVNATTSVNIQEMEAVVKQVFRECSQCYQHHYKKNWLLLDIDLTGLLAGKKAEGSENAMDAEDKLDECMPVNTMRLSTNSYMLEKCNWKPACWSW